LEAVFWDALLDIARTQDMPIARLVAAVDAARDGATPLASALRVLALRDALRRAGDTGAAGLAAPADPLADLTER
jgi:predicted DNA-binding ribbon-helix-helix protein